MKVLAHLTNKDWISLTRSNSPRNQSLLAFWIFFNIIFSQWVFYSPENQKPTSLIYKTFQMSSSSLREWRGKLGLLFLYQLDLSSKICKITQYQVLKELYNYVTYWQVHQVSCCIVKWGYHIHMDLTSILEVLFF